MVVIRMIIGRSLTPLNSSSTMQGVRRRDENSRGKVQNVPGDSSAVYDLCMANYKLLRDLAIRQAL